MEKLKKKIVVIVGPTGVGKSQVAVQLAQKFSGEILNFDSRQIYKEMTIGTAKPSEKDFGGVGHHLFDVCEVSESWDAIKMRGLAVPIIDKISLPFIVGGTGLYIRSLLYGFFDGPKADDGIRAKLEKQIEAQGLAALYAELEEIDPEVAKKIHPNDPTRIVRALEVYELTGKPMSKHQEEHAFKEPHYHYLKIGLNIDRKVLYQKIDARVDAMLEAGLEEEVKILVEKYGADGVLKKAIGYSEWFDYWAGKISRGRVIELIKQHSRNYAKRQITWFKNEKDVNWFEPSDLQGMEDKIASFV